ncbi:MAG: copper-binding protein [Bryobacteraceae bacterium]
MRSKTCCVILFCALALFSCKKAPPARQYAMHGEVLAISAQDHTATIKHEKIGDWMEAMTMEYPIKNEAEFKKLAVGDRIDATVFVNDSSYYVGNIQVIAKGAGPVK